LLYSWAALVPTAAIDWDYKLGIPFIVYLGKGSFVFSAKSAAC